MTARTAGTAKPVAARLTARGRGAVATVRYHGDVQRIDAAAPPFFQAANGRPLADQPLGRIVFGHWGAATSEEVVVCRTAPETLEIHCHGGDAAVRRILDDLRTIGVEVISWQQLLAGGAGEFAAECAAALAAATTVRTADILLQQQSGLLASELQECSALAASGHADARDVLLQRIDQLLRWSRFGLHLTQPWSVVLAGRPNVGKSSLINRLLGYARSIVYDQPGTTRDIVTAQTALDGWPIQFTDTAGIRHQAEELESAGIERAQQQMAQADLRLLLLDTSQPPQPDDRQLLGAWPDALIIAHKSDLPGAWGDEHPKGALHVSSKTGEGVDELAHAIVARLVPEVPAQKTPIPFTCRQINHLRDARDALLQNDLAQFQAILHQFLR